VSERISVPTEIRSDTAPQFSITLQEQPAGTLVLWEQAFDDDAVASAIRHIVEPANEQNLDRLRAEVQSAGLTAI
jgi:hypothetical protein